jgi:hypothetical protein
MVERNISSCFGGFSGGARTVDGTFLTDRGERFYRIDSYDRMPAFFMTLTSPSNHWLFISSTGGLTAGRSNSEHALFPYYTEDRIAENSENTGSKSIIRLAGLHGVLLWEPFSDRYEGLYRLHRSLSRNFTGNKLLFEELNEDLQLSFRLMWTFAPRYGIVKQSRLVNLSAEQQSVSLVDGIQNTLPGNTVSLTQNMYPNLLDAYKRQEIEHTTGTGLFYLNAEMSDRAEPAESLYATTWWQRGLEENAILLSSGQLAEFRRSGEVHSEDDVRGIRGSYFIKADLKLEPGREKSWYFCGEVDQHQTSIAALVSFLARESSEIIDDLEEDIAGASHELLRIIGRGDGLQLSGREMNSVHHAANVLFNTMRGGYFVNLSAVRRSDILNYLNRRNRTLPAEDLELFRGMPQTVHWEDVLNRSLASSSRDTARVIGEYLPLTFSRRHGDPSRPWNRFSIDTVNPDGTARIGYAGNWRDIFQNWEAMLRSFPSFVFSVINRFLNSTTADGYNPYRITLHGVEWEKPDEDDPWANIGYWSDHQIIYLSKLMEIAEDHFPGQLTALLSREASVYVDIPYRIRPLERIMEDPRNTIDFDEEKDRLLEERKKRAGEDGTLLRYPEGETVYASAAEKILVLILAKLVNFVPDGGIWMNTQRPEWNDANNALVGYGLSMVTLAYLDRFVSFLLNILKDSGGTYPFHLTVLELLTDIESVLLGHRPSKQVPFSDSERYSVLLQLGSAGSRYREKLYNGRFSQEKTEVGSGRIRSFLELVQDYFECSMSRNFQEDGLFHSYNRLEFRGQQAAAVHLHEMLEGQVAVLSAPICGPGQAVRILEAMKRSSLYRPDQNSYMLYPNRKIKSFLEKNCVKPEELENYPRIQQAVRDPGSDILKGILDKGRDGRCHFSPDFRNSGSLREAVRLGQAEGSAFPEELLTELLDLYEAVFDHKSFTGRSGTFFAYEGLGSIYWHMVSKLLLAVQEKLLTACRNGERGAAASLIERYLAVREGLGYRKSAEQYGAFPADPYSHTPLHSGAKQPGMTGQVKEEIITRLLENGIIVSGGRIHFTSLLVDDEEYLTEQADWTYYDVNENRRTLPVPAGCFAYTFCGVPVIAGKGSPRLKISSGDGTGRVSGRLICTADESRSIFNRSGRIDRIDVLFPTTFNGQKIYEELRSSTGG